MWLVEQLFNDQTDVSNHAGMDKRLGRDWKTRENGKNKSLLLYKSR